MSEIVHVVGDPPLRVYEVRVTLKNREELRGYCRGEPNPWTLREWLSFTMEMPFKCKVVVKTEEIAYIKYRPRIEVKE